MKQEAGNIAPWIDTDLGIAYTTPLGGLAKIWQLPVDHPFQPCFVYHDSMWDLAKSGKAPYPTSKPVDKEFYRRCMAIAQDNLWLQEEAQTFYLFCRAWGRARWPVNGDPATMARIKEAQEKAAKERGDG